MKDETAPKSKICFVIAPIGSDGSEMRLRSDQVLKHIIAPSVQICGYEAVRADHISEPGLITSQVIQHIVDDPLVIADLTGRNPNVFYELALRHALKKPVVQLIQVDEPIPFDIATSRTIHVDHRDLDSVAKAREEIVRQIRSVEQNSDEIDNPILAAIELQFLRRSDNPLEKGYAEIMAMLSSIRFEMTEWREGVRRRPSIPAVFFQELIRRLEQLELLVRFEENEPISAHQSELVRAELRRVMMLVTALSKQYGEADLAANDWEVDFWAKKFNVSRDAVQRSLNSEKLKSLLEKLEKNAPK